VLRDLRDAAAGTRVAPCDVLSAGDVLSSPALVAETPGG
jgi:hypothetical protein